MTAKSIAHNLDADTNHRVERLAERRRSTAQGLMQEALSQYLDREEKREAYRQDALAAWPEHQATGLHVDASEVKAWLETWGKDSEQVKFA